MEQKQIAEQQAQQAKFVVEQKKQEAEQARQAAQGQADAAVIASKGAAEARLIQAEAEAKANDLLSQIAHSDAVAVSIYFETCARCADDLCAKRQSVHFAACQYQYHDHTNTCNTISNTLGLNELKQMTGDQTCCCWSLLIWRYECRSPKLDAKSA